MKGNKGDTFNPPLGAPPSIEWKAVGELLVDHSYQRQALGAKDGAAVIKRIAQNWDWRLCAPLTVSRRVDPVAFYVIDGQHRLEAARLRGDIAHLPCITSTFGTIAEEAACFVDVNTKRKQISSLDNFRAQLASGNESAMRISRAIHDAGLSVAPHGNFHHWRPGQISAIGGIRGAIARYGVDVAQAALVTVAKCFDGEVLRYSGRILGGLYPLHKAPPPQLQPRAVSRRHRRQETGILVRPDGPPAGEARRNPRKRDALRHGRCVHRIAPEVIAA